MHPSRIHTFRHLILIAALCALFASGARAVTVTTTADSGPGSLRQAIADAPPYGKIDFDPSLNGSTIVVSSELSIDATTLTIQGPGADLLTISGDRACGVFYLGATTSVTLSGLTIRDGWAWRGSGIATSGDLIVRDCVIENCAGSTGAGIYASTGSGREFTEEMIAHLVIENCRLTSNSSTVSREWGGGGAVAMSSVKAVIRDSVLDSNEAVADYSAGCRGGAILASGGSMRIERSTITRNRIRAVYAADSASAKGGAMTISTNKYGPTVIRDCYIASNTLNVNGYSAGSCMYLLANDQPVTIESSLIEGHGPSGMTIWSVSTSLTLTNCTLAGNTSEDSYLLHSRWSSAYEVPPTGLVLSHCTVASNTILTQPAIVASESTITLEATVISGNVRSSTQTEVSGPVRSMGYNLVDSLSTGTLDGPGDMLGANPMLGPLADNGGPTRTMQPLPGSPLVDAIPYHDTTVATDQRGILRPVGRGGDIGACEAILGATLAPRQAVAVDADESCWAGVWDYTANAWTTHLEMNASSTVEFPMAPGEWTGLTLYRYGTASWVGAEYVYRQGE